MVRVAVIDDYAGAAATLGCWADLPDGVEAVFFDDHVTDPDELVERLGPFEAVIAMRERTPFPAALLERLPALRLLVTTGMHNAAVDIDAARDLGVTVCGTRLKPYPAAEMTWALILGLMKRTCAEDAALRSGVWQTGVGGDLDGAVLGVVGLGKLGSRVAAVGRAFGMEVLAWSQNLTPERAAREGARAVSKEELLRRSDVVTLHLRLSGRTRSVLSGPDLRLMKPTAYLVNTSRAPLVEEEALLTALHEGWIAGAGLDVHHQEPLPPDHPVLRAPNTLLTPHLGYATHGTFELCYSDAVECVSAFLAGEPVRVLPGKSGAA
ncbi:D-2-hydroxyacid dehydrogenase family protein [Streptomyces thermolineatus]|uniref:D-2-hydroxyacid dehydrogenase family protein n=1 Tax=Streptomyces thermolineatus TaxID=44033 RepID=UPI00384E0871